MGVPERLILQQAINKIVPHSCQNIKCSFVYAAFFGAVKLPHVGRQHSAESEGHKKVI